MTKETQFKAQLRNNIRAFIKSAKNSGTVAMSERNLLQCVKTPSTGLDGAPMGTNAQWVYAQIFSEVAREPSIKRFIISS